MPAVVAFDLDDTLFSEWDYIRSGYRAVAKAVADATGADADELARIMTTYRPKGFEAVLHETAWLPGADRFTVEGMIEMYRAHTPEIGLRHDARETLETLRNAGASLILITDGSTRHQRTKLKALGLEEFFTGDRILVSEETGGDKTTDVPWRLVRERFGSPGTRFFYVGDNLSKDFRLPNLAGWTTIMLRDTENNNVFPQEPRVWPAENRPQYTIDSLSNLNNILLPCLQHS